MKGTAAMPIARWIFLGLAALALSIPAEAHRSGCHAVHSCPSDSGSYVCGDLGHCEECPDNEFCMDGEARADELPLPTKPPAIRELRKDTASTEQPDAAEDRWSTPDRQRTPGAINADVTQENIHQTVCVVGWTSTVRPSTSYTEALKRKQMREFGIPGTADDYHEDHYVPLCVGGHPKDRRNLWPQPIAGKWADRFKNQLELSVCRAVCLDKITLKEGQAIFLDEPDWRRAYEKFFELK